MKDTISNISFFEMLLTLIKSKINLADSLYILSGKDMPPSVQRVSEEILTNMKKGHTFSDGLAAANTKRKILSPVHITLIKSAELTGQLDEVFENILFDIKMKKQSQQTLFGALVYPIIIVCSACAGTTIILIKGIPLFIQSGFLSESIFDTVYIGIIGAGCFLLFSGAVLLLVYYRIFGRDSAEYKIFYLLSFLLKGNIPLNDALAECIANIGESPYGRALVKIKKDVASGAGFSQTFANCRLFSSFVVGWLTIADKDGNLYEVCKNISNYYQERTMRTRAAASKFIEPAVIVIVGIYLIILIQTIILPMLSYIGGIL